jgi:DNA primase
MSDGVIDQIKQKLDILEVLGDYIRLTKAGRNWKARCPFHAERTPSFMVSPERQIWHCFGCGLGGDIFGFVMKMEGIEFGDALRLLARKAGVVLKKQDPQIQSQKKRLYEICELAARFFEVQLQKTKEGEKALSYLKERGLKTETIKEWRVGWAHDKWRALYEFLKSRGHKDEEILQAGLCIETNEQATSKQGKRYYDRFRSRIIFPIFDIQGQVVAFGGRIFGDKAANKKDVAKYVNSPQTPLYDKSSILYGLNKAKNEIRHKDQCVVVEGYMDLIMSYQAGVKNVVASSGTALTETQLNIIGRYTKNLVFAFDSDEAGNMATRRSIDSALKQDFNIKVISIKDKDPADIAKKNSSDWLKAIENAQGIMDFYFAYAFAKHNSQTLEGKREIRKLLLPSIKSLFSQTEQSEWLKELAQRLRADERDLLMDLKRIKIAPTETPAALTSASENNKSRQEGLEERFLGLCLNNPQHFEGAAVSESDFSNQQLAQIYSEFKNAVAKKKEKDLIAHLRRALAPDLKIRIDYLSLQIEQHQRSEAEIISEIKTCLRELKIVRLKQELSNLSFEIKDAQAEKNKTKLEKLLKKFNQLSINLTQLTS